MTELTDDDPAAAHQRADDDASSVRDQRGLPGWLMAGRPLDPKAAAERAQSFIYGNIVVMGVLFVIGPAGIDHAENLALLVATVIGTFAAHAVAEAYGKRVLTGRRPRVADIVETLRDSVPILSAGALPVVLAAASTLGLLISTAAFAVAVLWVVLRFLLLGVAIGRLRGTQSSWRTFATGAGLAAISVLAAAIKLLTAH